MKTNIIFLSILVMLSGLWSCKKAVQDAKNAKNVLESTKEGLENMAEEMEESNKKMEERRANGDTVAMHYTKLQEYLPTVKGYDAEEPKGETVQSMGYSVSMASQVFTKGEAKLTVKISDYAGAAQAYTGAAAMFSSGLYIENDEQLTKGLELKYVKGMEQFKKKSGNVTVWAGIGSRFIVEITAEKQEDTELAKSVLQSLPLKEMDSM